MGGKCGRCPLEAMHVLRGAREPRPLLLGAAGGACVVVLAATFLVAATVASAETITTEEPTVLENGEPAVEVSQLTADAVTTVAGTPIKCKKVYGWHGLKHPLFGYFYWFYEAGDGPSWQVYDLRDFCRLDRRPCTAPYRPVLTLPLAIR
jgi:hypothetical protein